MPQVPSYSTPQVRPDALPGVRQSSNMSPALAGGIAAQQTADMGRAMGALGQRMQQEEEKADQVRINDAMNKAVGAKLKLTHDKDIGFSNLRGEAALNRPDGKPLDQEYGDRFNEQIAEIEKGLGNDNQRKLFRQQVDQMAVQFKGGLQAHVAKEYGDYQLSVQDGTVKTAQDQMALDWDKPEAVGQSRAAIEAAVYETGRLRGWSPQQVKAATVDQLSRGHTSVMAAAVDNGRLDYAREYLKTNKDQMTPEARLAVTKVLDAGDFETRTQGAAESLYGANKGDVAAALAAARAKHTGKDEDAIVQRIKAMDGERVALRERAQADAADQAWGIYARGGRIPPSVMAAMDGKQLEALRRTQRVDAEAAMSKKEVKTDPNVYYALAAAAGGDPNFKAMDLRPFFDKLGPTERKHFIDLQTKAAKPEGVDEVVGVGEQKSAMVKTLGLRDEEAGTFHQVADKALFAAQQAKGKKLDQDERQKVLDRLAMQGTVPGSWFGTNNTPMYKAVAEGRGSEFKAEFSDADRNKAKAALQRAGVTAPTKQQIDATMRAAYGIK